MDNKLAECSVSVVESQPIGNSGPAIANRFTGAKTHAAKAHEALMLYPGGLSLVIELYRIGRTDALAVSARNARIGYGEVVRLKAFIDIDAFIEIGS